ncbi:META domain-containing protein [Deinococcus sp. YIM 134068]|uniref:META domain-containing protein n=1 Tax=Deinococcus lichenicola TaxID=3118910 RepID=UPI002F93C65E
MRPLTPLAVALTLALGASASAQSAPLTGTTWTLTGLTDGGRLVAPGRLVRAPTLRLDGRLASGITPCNLYRAPYAAREKTLRLGRLATTRRACPDRVDGLEERFVGLLRGVTRYTFSGTTLTLLAGERDRLVFAGGGGRPSTVTPTVPQPEASVNLDGDWTLTGGTAVQIIPGTPPALTLANGRVSGTGGCNRLTGTLRAEGETLTFGPLATTRRLCTPELNAQESAFLTFLGTPLTTRVAGDSLTLTNAGGQTLVFGRGRAGSGAVVPDSDSAQGTFTLSTVDGRPAPQTARFVTLTLEGERIGVTDGCNVYISTYRVEGGRLALLAPPTQMSIPCLKTPSETSLSAAPTAQATFGVMDLPALLAAAPTLSVTDRALTLSANGTTLVFTRTPIASARIQTWEVDGQLVPCTGIGPMSCLRVRREGGDWQLFYSQIEGFTFQPGVRQLIRVREEDRPTPVPADASSKRYVLVEVVERR